MAGPGAPKTPRQDLLEAIEAYAASKSVDDKLLQKLAMVNLAQTLKKYDILAPVPNPPAPIVEAAEKALELKKEEATKKTPTRKPAARKPRATKKTS